MRTMKLLPLSCAALLALLAAGMLAAAEMPRILPERERAALQNHWLEIRLETVIPELMRRERIDMWVVVAREYNEDPLFETMAPATWFSARRRTILVFHDRGPEVGVERLTVSRYDLTPFFANAWDPAAQPDQWARLAAVIAERDPRRIALNVSTDFALADGLSHSEREALVAALPERLRGRLVSGERLAVGWLERRIPEEMAAYRLVGRIAHTILEEGLSEAAILPGHTTTADVQWWYRDRFRELGLDTWFHPSVSVQRHRPEGGHEGDFATRPGEETIQPGDLLHVDLGITYLGLNTDTQRHAYVLRAGESEAPEGLRRALAVGNRAQDILTGELRAGRTGNEILAAALAAARAEGIEATIYTHPLGFHGHGAGPLIGLWDQQEGVPGRGDYPLFPHTVHSIELNVAVEIREWDGQEIRVMLEEDALFDGERVGYIDGRQTDLLLIPRQRP